MATNASAITTTSRMAMVIPRWRRPGHEDYSVRCRQPSDATMLRVSVLSQLVTRAASAIDQSAIRFMERRVRPASPRRAPRDARQLLVDLASRYGDDNTLGVPSAFFPEPKPAAIARTRAGQGPHGATIYDLAFPSEYKPYLAAYRDEHQRHRENLIAHARMWTRGPGRPAIILLHGWGGGTYWITERTFAVEYWLRHEFDVIAFQLPLHGHRAPSTGPLPARSGALFLSP